MVVPVGHTVQLRLRHQDVIHSLFIPAMRFKQTPFRGWKSLPLHSHQIGNYEIACAELVWPRALSHARNSWVVSEDAFEKWMKSQETAAAGH